ncbi:sulfotransferase family 2 domain-containing protein [Halomonas saccharevitans]|uniref:Sulfotransferase family 2 domain-containing protein n=1 Tax=Halomonas saccharevitans TaxID=416872 RepID=A0ABU3NAT0_9GAMM|nr:sulfotransferase family 2 domain-containing protein [Halomonas saccharevitans]MDT8878311.1 sulfotransferase family 2 domain-containing protein [Halomonas saccharevitans]
MIKKSNESFFSRLGKFSLLILRNPKQVRTYARSGLKDKYSLRDVKATGILFLHIPKCAGVSVNNALYSSLGAGHTDLDRILVGLGPLEFTNVFKFSIVRNPWDRLVSAYFFLKNGGFGQRDKEFFDSHLSHYKSFDHFVRDWLSEENVMRWNHFIPQHKFLSIVGGVVDLNYLCFFESLEEDFSNIYDAKQWERFKGLSMDNKSSHKDYRIYYTDETIKAVESVYKEDVELFGYDFHGKNYERQVSWRNKEFPLVLS